MATPEPSVVKLTCEQVLDGWRCCTLLQVLVAATVLRYRSVPSEKQWAQLNKAIDSLIAKEIKHGS